MSYRVSSASMRRAIADAAKWGASLRFYEVSVSGEQWYIDVCWRAAIAGVEYGDAIRVMRSMLESFVEAPHQRWSSRTFEHRLMGARAHVASNAEETLQLLRRLLSFSDRYPAPPGALRSADISEERRDEQAREGPVEGPGPEEPGADQPGGSGGSGGT